MKITESQTIDLPSVLAAHAEWLRDQSKGCRANLRGADLRGADLRGADLFGANLLGANLSEANLSGADLRESNLCRSNLRRANLSKAYLRRADLHEANLRSADLHEANLSDAAGVVCLPIGDPRGYRPVAVMHGSEWIIASGCRWFTQAEALKHWGEAYRGNRAIGNEYLAGLDWLALQQIGDDK